MAARDVLKNLNLFVDGRGYAGQLTEYNAPDLTLAIEDFRGGGMDGSVPLDMGMEALTASFTLIRYSMDVLSLWGVAESEKVPFMVRGALVSYDETVTPLVHQMRGRIVSLERGGWAPGQQNTLTCNLALDYYKETHGGVVISEIDVVNMVRIVGGVDHLAAQRAALGV